MNSNIEPESHEFKCLLDKYSTRLYIDINTYQQDNIANNFVEPGTEIKNIRLSEITVFEDDDFRIATTEELTSIEYPRNEITISSNGYSKTFISKTEKGFTVGELFYRILEVEKESRETTEWFGGIDAHHIFFEGLHLNLDGSYSVFWGS